MATHLFLTGEKRVGKSTLLNRLLMAIPGPHGGFRTLRCQHIFPGCLSLHLLRVGTNEVPAPENFLVVCGQPDAAGARRFDRLGCAALSENKDVRLLVMDELGPHEGEALAFRAAVCRALDGDIPILGVLQKADSEFLCQIAMHPHVRVVEVTAENRDSLAETLQPSFGLPV